MQYFGGKEASGTYQRIINMIPPHKTYIEPFLGGGAIWRLKKPAEKSIVLDLDEDAIAQAKLQKIPRTSVLAKTGIEFLESYQWKGNEFVYADPPYMISTRTSNHRYKHELTNTEHLRLLKIIKKIPAPVLISGYYSPLYERELKKWEHVTFTATTRGRTKRKEYLWRNYPQPTQLHDYRYLGTDYIDRQRIHRKISRWINRLKKLPPLERQAILESLQDR